MVITVKRRHPSNIKVLRLKQKQVPAPSPEINCSERLASLELKLNGTTEKIRVLSDEKNMLQKEVDGIRKSLAEAAGEAGNARKKATLESQQEEKYEQVDALLDRLEIVQKELADIRKSLSEVAEEARNAKRNLMSVVADLQEQARKKSKT
ncbi:hypothetical protein AgCh_001558 [Apium graveolens]